MATALAPEEAVQANEQLRRDKERRVIMGITHPQALGNQMLGVCQRARFGRRRQRVRLG